MKAFEIQKKILSEYPTNYAESTSIARDILKTRFLLNDLFEFLAASEVPLPICETLGHRDRRTYECITRMKPTDMVNLEYFIKLILKTQENMFETVEACVSYS